MTGCTVENTSSCGSRTYFRRLRHVIAAESATAHFNWVRREPRTTIVAVVAALMMRPPRRRGR